MSSRGYRVVNIEPVTDDLEYTRRRRERYPETYRHEVPSSSCERDYNTYHNLLDRSNESKKKYFGTKDEYRRQTNPSHAADVSHYPEGGYLKRQLRGLEPRYHGLLVDPCLEAEHNLRRHADARANYLEAHPYGYRTLNGRDSHVEHMEDAYEDAQLFNSIGSEHVNLAKSTYRDRSSSRRPRSRVRYDSDDERPSHSRTLHADGSAIMTVSPRRR